jgi:thiamine biosynthesis lipoprotein
MACRFEITFDAKNARYVPLAQAALNEIDAIESQLTVFRATSAVCDVNRRAAHAPVPVETSLFELLARCKELSASTDGAFDITSTPLSRCWGFLQREGRLPTRDQIAAARAVVGIRHVELDASQATVRFGKPGVELNFGAIGKGYALDSVAATLRTRGVLHALLSAGQSSLMAIGHSHRGWCVDIVSPHRDRPLARVWLSDTALGTSGAGEQFAVIDGRRYGHVLDPRTGAPAEGILSTSVLCTRAADADALSTAFFVGGPELARRYCDQHAEVLVLSTPDDGSGRTFVIGRRAGVEIEDI